MSNGSDFNATCAVSIAQACLCSACRLCHLRNKPNPQGGFEPMVEIEATLHVPHRVYYCVVCYDFLKVKAVEGGSDLPDSSALPWTGIVPAYLVKDLDPLRLFYPEDNIELGAWRQKRRRQQG